jgi:hypothetical protein
MSIQSEARRARFPSVVEACFTGPDLDAGTQAVDAMLNSAVYQ